MNHLDLPIMIADDDFLEYLYDLTSIELEDLIVEYEDWERENVTLFSRLMGRLRRLK